MKYVFALLTIINLNLTDPTTYIATLPEVVVTPPSPDKDSTHFLAKLIFCESAHEPIDGKIAVGNVVTNRMSYMNQTIEEVIFAKGQFDGIRNRYWKNWEHYKNKYPNKWSESIKAAKLALIGVKKVPEDILFYHNKKTATDTNWVRLLSKYEYVTIGNHTFCFKIY